MSRVCFKRVEDDVNTCQSSFHLEKDARILIAMGMTMRLLLLIRGLLGGVILDVFSLNGQVDPVRVKLNRQDPDLLLIEPHDRVERHAVERFGEGGDLVLMLG